MISSPFDRTDYPSLRQSVYLNQASLGLIGQPSVTAMHTFIDNVARHGNLYMSDRDEVAYCETLRGRASRLLHCDSSQVAIVASASEILGQLPMLLQPRLKSTILAVSSDFPAITRPWLRLAALKDHTVLFVDDQPTCDLTDTLIAAIDESTSVVAVSSVQYATGTVVDISTTAPKHSPGWCTVGLAATCKRQVQCGWSDSDAGMLTRSLPAAING